MTRQEFWKFIEENEVLFVDLKVVDFYGGWKHVTLPIETVNEKLLENGIGIFHLLRVKSISTGNGSCRSHSCWGPWDWDELWTVEIGRVADSKGSKALEIKGVRQCR
jgi:hypothetical protein